MRLIVEIARVRPGDVRPEQAGRLRLPPALPIMTQGFSY